MSRFKIVTVCAGVIVLLGSASGAAAQGVDLTFFVGQAFPTYDDRLIFRPSNPALPGVDVVGSPVIKATGGPVFGGAITIGTGILGLEARLDSTEVGLEFTGAQYNFRGTQPPFQGLTASIIISDGKLNADRIPLFSVNARIHTPGPLALFVSGGLSYLSSIDLTGSIPLRIDVAGIPTPPGFDPKLTLRALPDESKHRWGLNGGAGLRIGGQVALIGEVRVFYFREYELRFEGETGLQILDELLNNLALVRFDPIFVNAQAGVTFRF